MNNENILVIGSDPDKQLFENINLSIEDDIIIENRKKAAEKFPDSPFINLICLKDDEGRFILTSAEKAEVK